MLKIIIIIYYEIIIIIYYVLSFIKLVFLKPLETESLRQETTVITEEIKKETVEFNLEQK